MNTKIETYDFSFTGFSLRVTEMIKVAKSKIQVQPFDAVNEIGGGKTSTTKKFLNEIGKRIDSLTPLQLELLSNGSLPTQKQVVLLSMCKVHGFIRDFVIEVMREKMLVFDNQITEGDYLTFMRRKASEHDELERLHDVTKKKIRQVLFRTLEEAGWINEVNERIIQPQILDKVLIEAIVGDDPSWLKIFFISDLDINRLTK